MSLCVLQIGVYNEKALQRLDLIVAEAGSNGVRVMFPFVNFRNDMGGMQWYVDQVCCRALSASSYAVPNCWQHLRCYAEFFFSCLAKEARRTSLCACKHIAG